METDNTVQPHARASAALCIGIAGGSGAGKSTFSGLLAAELNDVGTAVLHQDRYFRDFKEVPEAEREAKRTVNSPAGMVWDGFIANFHALRHGQAVSEPVAGTRASSRMAAAGIVQPAPVIIVEGLFALWHDELRASLDLGVFLEAPDDERVIRRLLRDVKERGTDLERAAAWYRRDVLPNYSVYTGASKRYAHLVVPWVAGNPLAVTLVADWVRAELARRTARTLQLALEQVANGEVR